jgi:hypothetical protein
MIPQAQNKCDANGKRSDETTHDFMTAHLTAFNAWVFRRR